MKVFRFLALFVLLCLGAAAFFVAKRSLHAREIKPAALHIAASDEAGIEIAEAQPPVAAAAEKRASVVISEEGEATPAESTNLMMKKESRPETNQPQPETVDWQAVVKLVLVYHQDSARRAIEGVMFDTGTDTWVVTGVNAGIAPDGVVHAIDRIFVERFDPNLQATTTQPAEHIPSEIPDLIFYRLKGRLTTFRLTDKANHVTLPRLKVGDVFVAQNVEIRDREPDVRRTARVTVMASNRAAALKMADGTMKNFGNLIQMNGSVREGTPVFRDGHLAGITLLGSRFIADRQVSFALPIERIREACRRAYVLDAAERALENDQHAAKSATATPEGSPFNSPVLREEIAQEEMPRRPVESATVVGEEFSGKTAETGPQVPLDGVPSNGAESFQRSKETEAIPPVDTSLVPPRSNVLADTSPVVNESPENGLVNGQPVQDLTDNIPLRKRTFDEPIQDSAGNLSQINRTLDEPQIRTLPTEPTPDTVSAVRESEPVVPGPANVLSEVVERKVPVEGDQVQAPFVIALQYLEPADAAQTLRSLFGDSADGHGVVRIAPNTTSRTIIVSAPVSVLKEIQSTLAELEKRAEVNQGPYLKWLKRNSLQTETQEPVAQEPGSDFVKGFQAPQNAQDAALSQLVKELAAKVRAAQGPDRDRLRTELEELTNRHFELRQQLRLQEIEDLARRVEQLRAAHTRRNEQKAPIVKRRITDLLEEDSDLKWDGAQRNTDSDSQTPQVGTESDAVVPAGEVRKAT